MAMMCWMALVLTIGFSGLFLERCLNAKRLFSGVDFIDAKGGSL